MAVPDSGALSLRGIRGELDNNNYNNSVAYTNVSLKDMCTGVNGTINTDNDAADRPDDSAPHSMSEWYSYDHDATSTPSLTSVNITIGSSGGVVCSGELFPTYYHDGGGSFPSEGDRIYANSNGTGELSAAYFKIELDNQYYAYSNSAGDGGGVGSSSGCGRSERRLKYNIEFIGDSPMGIPMYHFNYKDESHGKGRFIGTMVDDLQRLGFEDVLINTNDGIIVDYSKIDVPFHNITNIC